MIQGNVNMDINIVNRDIHKRRKSMRGQRCRRGFTLIELMIVVAIVAILVALALPSYARYIRKANRGEAQQLMLNWANMEEIWRANNATYADETELAVPTHGRYTFTVTNETATTYTLTADPTGDQAKDKDRDTLCDPLTLDQSNVKGPQITIGGNLITRCW
jgi:type IV pilus assembly protein PilE